MSTVHNHRYLPATKLLTAPPLPRVSVQKTTAKEQNDIVEKMFAKMNCHKEAVKWLEISAACFIVIAFVFALAWPNGSGGASPCPWHIEVVDHSIKILPSHTGMRIAEYVSGMLPVRHWEFSMGKFLTSFSGWIVIVGLVTFVVSIVLSLRAENKSERKMRYN